MLTLKVYNQNGQVVGDIELDASIFGVAVNPGLIEQAIVTTLANRRTAIAHTKTRGEVRGGGKKPWRQKGTGRARQGSIRSPQWRGGGVIFGPRSNRNFTLKMNTVARRQALRMALSDKAKHEHLTVVDKLNMAKPKTKDFFQVLKNLTMPSKSLIVLPATDLNLIKAGRNIPGLKFIRADNLNTFDVIHHPRLLLVQDSLPVINRILHK